MAHSGLLAEGVTVSRQSTARARWANGVGVPIREPVVGDSGGGRRGSRKGRIVEADDAARDLLNERRSIDAPLGQVCDATIRDASMPSPRSAKTSLAADTKCRSGGVVATWTGRALSSPILRVCRQSLPALKLAKTRSTQPVHDRRCRGACRAAPSAFGPASPTARRDSVCCRHHHGRSRRGGRTRSVLRPCFGSRSGDAATPNNDCSSGRASGGERTSTAIPRVSTVIAKSKN